MTSIAVLLGVFIFIFGIGYFLLSRVPPLLHTPLMSATNAISSITILGAFILLAIELEGIMTALVAGAIILASFNCIGGFVLTDRMFKMFKKKE
jgi:NAD(P) transhydrogenase subunit alpha